MSRVYIGMATSQHDPAIAIVDEQGKVLFAEAIERASKNKRAWNTVPDQIGCIEPIMKKYIQDNDVIVATSWSPRTLKWSPLILAFTHLRSRVFR